MTRNDMSPRVLVAGIGNIFLGDDGFGCEVARRLSERTMPGAVRVEDFGIRSFDLAYALLDGYDATIFVDAVPRGDRPGTIYTIEPDLSELNEPGAQAVAVEAHAMNPMKALALAKAMGGEFKRVLLVGCEPLTLGPEEGMMGLSEPVEAAVVEAARVVVSLVEEIIKEDICYESVQA